MDEGETLYKTTVCVSYCAGPSELCRHVVKPPWQSAERYNFERLKEGCSNFQVGEEGSVEGLKLCEANASHDQRRHQNDEVR